MLSKYDSNVSFVRRVHLPPPASDPILCGRPLEEPALLSNPVRHQLRRRRRPTSPMTSNMSSTRTARRFARCQSRWVLQLTGLTSLTRSRRCLKVRQAFLCGSKLDLHLDKCHVDRLVLKKPENNEKSLEVLSSICKRGLKLLLFQVESC